MNNTHRKSESSEAERACPQFAEQPEDLEAAEQEWLHKRREVVDLDPGAPTLGLSFSGGGIRSATFNLGVLQALEKMDMLKHVDYLSSVSGGGYIASCFTWLRSKERRAAKDSLFAAPTKGDHGSVLEWLRAHGKYLISERGFSGWTLGASILAATLLNLLVILPPMFLLVALASLDVMALEWPAWVQSLGVGPIAAHDGYALLFWSGVVALALYPVLAVIFAFVSGYQAMRSQRYVMRMRKLMGLFLNLGIAFIAIGLIPVIAALEGYLLQQFNHASTEYFSKAMTVIVPMLSGMLAMNRANKQGGVEGSGKRGLATVGLAAFLYGFLMFSYHLVMHVGIMDSPWLWLATAMSFILAMTCDINWISMHSYYRSRLAEAFMPPVGEPGSSAHKPMGSMGFLLKDIDPKHGGPFHIINTTLNTSSSSHQKLRARGGDNFIFSPLYCGSKATGYRATTAYAGGDMALSTAFSVSGAAVDPNTIFTRARPQAFLMAALNFRLGFWSENPGKPSSRLPLPWWYIFIGREMFGHGLDETTRHVHLSDGGQFDNLGVYELLRRKCRRIIVCDAGADPKATMSDLGKVVQRARTDFCAEVNICVDALRKQADMELCKTPFAMGNITYADGSKGELLYIKPLMRDGLTVDIYSYWRENPAFPNQPTSNQFFDEEQFNAYRALGKQMISGIANDQQVKGVAEFFQFAQNALKQDDADAATNNAVKHDDRSKVA